MVLLLLVARRFQRAPSKDKSDREGKHEGLSQRKRTLEPCTEKVRSERQSRTDWPPSAKWNRGVYQGRLTQVHPLKLLWQNHSRLSRRVRMGAQEHGVWLGVANSVLWPMGHISCLPPPARCLESITSLKPCLPSRESRSCCKIRPF